MKRFTAVMMTAALTAGILSGCGFGSEKKELSLDSKHKPLPDYVLNASPIVQETYMLAAQYPEVVSSVPCYCGCNEQDGHESNLDCFIDQMGPDNEVLEWDAMSIS
ncbi:Lipoprotein [Mesobacillus zeae]